MKRYQVILLFFVGIIIVLWFVARITGALQLYNFPTSSMEPTIHVGQKFFTTNLTTAGRNDIITFIRMADKYGMPDSNGQKNIFSSRLIATEGDKLEIRNGYAYINQQLADDTTRLKFEYSFSNSDVNSIATRLSIDLEKNYYSNEIIQMDAMTSVAFLSFDQYEKTKNLVALKRVIITDTSYILKEFGARKWSVDEFGPYIIPPGHVFVLGDNRHNAQDSRYVGPIPMKDIKGVLIAKF
jgi:signal peptidase I